MEENGTENTLRLLHPLALKKWRAGEQVLLERLFSDIHLSRINLSSFWRWKIDESTSGML